MRKTSKAFAVVMGLVLAPSVTDAASGGMGNMVKCDFRAFEKHGPSGPALVTHVPNRMTPIALSSVQIVDKNIRKKIMPQAVFARTTQTGSLEVKARLVNCTDYMQEVLVRTSFMDANQFPAEPTSAWQRVFLAPRSTQVYSEKSLKSGIGYYLIEVDEGD